MTDVTKRTPGATMTHRIGPPGFDRRSREEVTANAVLMALAPALFETVLWAISELEELDDETAQVVVKTLRSTLTGSED